MAISTRPAMSVPVIGINVPQRVRIRLSRRSRSFTLSFPVCAWGFSPRSSFDAEGSNLERRDHRRRRHRRPDARARLHRAGIACRVYEAAPEIKPLGVGINLLPHATRELARLGLEATLARVARHHARSGLLQPLRPAHLSRAAGPLRRLRLAAVLDPPRRPAAGAARRGARAHRRRAAVVLGWTLHRRSTQDDRGVVAQFRYATTATSCRRSTAASSSPATALHSVDPQAAASRRRASRCYSGVNMWRGVTRWPPFLTGATHDPRRLARRRQDGDLSDPRRRRRRGPPARQLGGRDRDAAARRARLEPARHGSTTSSARSPTGTSTGSTCRR